MGPELAEDHSTTLLMNTAGWQGVHALEADAHGEGPLTFGDCMVQEFQWSKSLVMLLLTLTPKCLNHLPRKLKFQFLFSQIWYPIFGLSMLVAYFLPIVALISRTPLVRINFIGFTLFSLLITGLLLSILFWLRKNKWLRPHNIPVISWELMIFQLVRWPWVLMGSISGIWDVVRSKTTAFRITPKGETGIRPLPFGLMVPYALVTLFSGLAGILLNDVGSSQGYYYFTIINGLTYAIVTFLIVILHINENQYALDKKV